MRCGVEAAAGVSTYQTLELDGSSLCAGFAIRRRALRIKVVVFEAVHATNVREKEVVPVKGDCSLAITDALLLFKCKYSHGYD